MMTKSQGRSGTPPGYSGLEFRLAEIRSEVKNFAIVCRPYLAYESREILGEWLAQLDNFPRTNERGSRKWSISEERPIRTRNSFEYEPGNRSGALEVHGQLACTWEVESKTAGQSKGKGGSSLICLNGKASTKIKILRTDPERGSVAIAQWQFEVGDYRSPGCHFHVGIGQFGSESAFLPVPRLPSILFTPLDALDFLLGEIFQTSWRKTVSCESAQMQEWSVRQKSRMSRLLKWMQNQVDESGGSAWNYLKHQRPSAPIFLAKDVK